MDFEYYSVNVRPISFGRSFPAFYLAIKLGERTSCSVLLNPPAPRYNATHRQRQAWQRQEVRHQDHTCTEPRKLYIPAPSITDHSSVPQPTETKLVPQAARVLSPSVLCNGIIPRAYYSMPPSPCRAYTWYSHLYSVRVSTH